MSGIQGTKQIEYLFEQGTYNLLSEPIEDTTDIINRHYQDWAQQSSTTSYYGILENISTIQVDTILFLPSPAAFYDALTYVLNTPDIKSDELKLWSNYHSQNPSKNFYINLTLCLNNIQQSILKITWNTLLEHLSEIEYYTTSLQSVNCVAEITILLQARLILLQYYKKYLSIPEFAVMKTRGQLIEFQHVTEEIEETDPKSLETTEEILGVSSEEEDYDESKPKADKTMEKMLVDTTVSLETPPSKIGKAVSLITETPNIKVVHRAKKLQMNSGKKPQGILKNRPDTHTKELSLSGRNTSLKKIVTSMSSMTAASETPPADAQYSVGCLLNAEIVEAEHPVNIPKMDGMRSHSIWCFGQGSEGDVSYTWPTTDAEHFARLEIYDARKMALLPEKQQWTSRIRQYNFALTPGSKILNASVAKIMMTLHKKADPKKNPSVSVTRRPKRSSNFYGNI